ncbi:uncharacterized protein LOC120189232 isoform X2 [Hibiscus syriacus]|uniref:uncharacterized protein LOC120189232 isoform X2 n=1 Tax=Hibiscus syriacus TaxID=106335 RepID=UPI0019222C7F|nr:uncharacterized protein LOC120189232 isoform X2 [Hibiscus syriacus]
MEDSGEIQTEENKVSLDVNKKRTVKTPDQVMALEKFYKELRFPSDEMKSQIALQVGLTEKQISSWFCHRRLKDKRRDEHANERVDHSSGVIRDRGSGLRQDSSGSIKERDYRNIDPREVESGRISSQEFLADRRSHQNPYDAHMEDTSSESSSPLQDMRFSESRDPHDMPTSVQLRQNGATLPIDANTRMAKSKVYKPSGYLKLKGESENPSITAVKRQLGRFYLEDGPLLGIEFDPPLNGAFEFPNSKPVSEPVDVGDPQQPHSSHISGVIKQPDLNFVDEVRNSMLSSHDSYMENSTFKTAHGFERQNKKSRQQLKYNSLLSSNSFPGQNSSLDIHNGSAEKDGVIDSKRSRMNTKLAVKRTRPYSFSNNPDPNGGKIDDEREKPCLHDDDNHTYYKALKKENLSKPSARMVKAEKLGGKQKPKNEYPVRVKTDPTNESRVAKQVNVEFPQQDVVSNASHARSPLLTNLTKRSTMDVPSSFSEDETAETCSSSG